MDHDSDESDFYGDPKRISALETRINSFSPSHHLKTHPIPNLITLHLTPSSPSPTIPPSFRLHNRYSHLPHCAYQLHESIDSFLTRLPPATTPRLPGLDWIFIANPYIPPPPSPSPSSSLTPNSNPATPSFQTLLKAGYSRLSLFEQFISTTKSKIKSPFQQKQHIAKARKELISDLKQLAISTGLTTGKWMLFPEPNQVNQVWAVVAKATANNELGIAAKVETKVETNPQKERLICVYTGDFRDKDDVARVLKRLKELGLVRAPGRRGEGALKQVYYKCDAWTELNIYGGNEWDIPASMVCISFL
ncbi:hypothetical protein QBC38DRAFT_164215 [Podospora fimiseda]|uniref:DUF1917-domain-containing protein n=1 Tax=Podospora fimiseda TaxID=252190 RepID=A0AAN7GVY9_9PEZI|nr:hypothetical protein QBC38DRAFT_164215 [Podospora fimiseda]